MRGGRNMGARGAITGEGGSGQIAVVTLFAEARTGPAFGSP
jgi:hypothetical protein